MSSSCKVCTAKRAGLAPPKRKCTCDSGVTAQRSTSSRTSVAAEQDPERDPMRDALPDLFDDYDVRVESIDSGSGCVCFPPNPAAQDFHEFEEALDNAAMTDDLAGVQAAMEQCERTNLKARYAYSVEETRRNALAIACMHGSKELLEYWLDGQKLLVSDRCPVPTLLRRGRGGSNTVAHRSCVWACGHCARTHFAWR